MRTMFQRIMMMAGGIAAFAVGLAAFNGLIGVAFLVLFGVLLYIFQYQSLDELAVFIDNEQEGFAPGSVKRVGYGDNISFRVIKNNGKPLALQCLFNGSRARIYAVLREKAPSTKEAELLVREAVGCEVDK